ncbi:MAG TPA: hypothetical protein VF713_05480 [Thermoanaerobaculia bacterium]
MKRAIFLALFATSLAAAEPEIPLQTALEANRFPIALADGKLSGSGMEVIAGSATTAQFVMISEPHNSRRVPEWTTALFEYLHRADSFNYLAVENGAAIMDLYSKDRDHDAAVRTGRRYPNGLQFTTDQELTMFADVAKISTAKSAPLWGVDRPTGVLETFERLSAIAATAEARKAAEAMAAEARPYEQERYGKNVSYLAEIAPERLELFARTYRAVPGSEAEFLVRQLITAVRNIRDFRDAATRGTGYLSNLEREEIMKELFIRDYRRAERGGDKSPRVLLKLGHWHLIRGMSWGHVFTLGNFVSELAASHGLGSLSIGVFLNNPTGDYGVLSSGADYKPLADAALADGDTLIDVRPLRPLVHSGRVKVNAEMERVIFGFDLVLLMRSDRGDYRLLQTANFRPYPP